MTRTKKILLVILINIISITLIVYAFELAFSPYPSLPVNGYVEDGRYTWGHLVKNNRFGFRERNFKVPKPPGTWRIMVLGDSLTWGAGLAVEERYTSITEEHLDRHFADRNFEVLNFAVSGGPTTRERDVLLQFKGVVDPDLIVVGFSLNDPQPKAQNYSIERDKLRWSVAGRTIHSLSQAMLAAELPYTSRLLNQTFYRFAEKIDLIPTWQNALDRAYRPQSNEWQEFVQALKDIKNMSDALNLPPPIFTVLNSGKKARSFMHYSGPDKKTKLFLQWYHQAEKTATQIGFNSYNHEYEIANQLEDEPLVINILDGHPSASLNRIYGEKLYQQIVKQVLRN